MRSDWKRNLFIGIPLAIIILFALHAIPSMIGMEKRARRAEVKSDIYRIQVAMEDFADKNNDTYPCSLTDTTINGDALINFVYYDLTNPYTENPVKVRFIGEPFPVEHSNTSIPPGDIYIYCNGSEYLILGGQEDSTPNSFRPSYYRSPKDN